jgi:hypothetical protein
MQPDSDAIDTSAQSYLSTWIASRQPSEVPVEVVTLLNVDRSGNLERIRQFFQPYFPRWDITADARRHIFYSDEEIALFLSRRFTHALRSIVRSLNDTPALRRMQVRCTTKLLSDTIALVIRPAILPKDLK